MFELYIKYLLEGIAVAVAAYFIPRKRVKITEIIFIALSAAATFALLDVFAPKVGDSARRGAGFGIGANTVGWPGAGLERFENSTTEEKKKDEKKTTQKAEKKADKKEDNTMDTTTTTETFASDNTSTTSDSSVETKSTETTEEPKETEVQPFESDRKYSTF